MRACSTASPPGSRPGRRATAHPSARARERRLGLHAGTALRRRPGPPHGASPPGRRPADRAPRAVAVADRRPGPSAPERAPAARGHDVLDEHATGPAARGAPPWRRRGAPETGDRHLRRWHRHPVRRIDPRSSSSAGAGGTVTASPGRCPRARRTPARRPSRPRCARWRRRPASRWPIVRPFDSIAYTFVQGGTRIHKTVHYFLMVPTGGDLVRHDHEFDEVRWIGFDEAADPADVRDGAGARRPGRLAASTARSRARRPSRARAPSRAASP